MPQQIVQEILDELHSGKRDARKLLHFYQDDDFKPAWESSSVLYREFGRKLISAGHLNSAFSLAYEGMLRHRQDAELRYLCGLSLARMGDITKAAKFVGDLRDVTDTKLRSDALCLLGRLRKDRYLRTDQPLRRTRLANESAEFYELAHAISFDQYAAINAATMHLLAGGGQQARDFADQIVRQSFDPSAAGVSYWSLATVGEAHLIRGDLDQAATLYEQAVRRAGSNRADIAAMRRNVQLLHQKVALSDDILELFQLGSVIAFCGEMIDHPARGKEYESCFPDNPELERLVAEAIREQLVALQATVGFCCPRAGSEILFAEQLLKCGGELHLILPFKLDDFDSICVHMNAPEMRSWHQRCRQLLSQAVVHYATKDSYLNDEVLFEFATQFTQGLAINTARQWGVEPTALVVLNTKQPSAVCTRFMETWPKWCQSSRMIDLASLQTPLPCVEKPATRTILPPTLPVTEGLSRREVRALLFADVKNFSSLNEDESPLFFTAFTKAVKSVIDGSEHTPVFCNTWGDGLYAVFDQVPFAADFAISLLEHMETICWSDLGLPSDTNVRIGLHVGPVYRHSDPILGKENYFGSHVNRAARIEPVTTPGCAFVSEQFAAALAVETGSELICVHVGVEPLAKGYDQCSLYWLGRK